MSGQAGLWIDHRRAFVVLLTEEGAQSKNILSNVEKHVKASGGSRSAAAYGPQDIVAEDRTDRKFQQHLEKYYEKVARALGDPDSVFIMGPGEAKHEFHKHLEKSKRFARIETAEETADKMTDGEIITKVRRYFLL